MALSFWDLIVKQSATCFCNSPERRRNTVSMKCMLDSETQEIQAMVLSEASLDDAGAVPELLDQSTEPVEQMSGDGAYDKGRYMRAALPEVSGG